MQMGNIFAIILVIILSSHKTVCKFYVKTSPDGGFQIIVNSKQWITSYDTIFHVEDHPYSLKKKTLLHLKSPVTVIGTDALGPYTKYVYSYKANSSFIDTAIQTYEEIQLLQFTQLYKNGATKTSVKNKDGVISGFPCFNVGSSDINLGVMAYGDVFSGYHGFKIYKWQKGMKDLPGGMNSGPLVLFDDQNNVLIISAFNHFMAASYVHNTTENTVSFGIMGNVDTVPNNYALETMVIYSDKGINEAMKLWGSVLRKWYNRDTAARDSDVTINYIGYYTDHGAYYYHHTETGMNYEDTLLKEFQYYKQLEIPYQYLQLDDWWYYWETSKTSYGAVVKWQAMPSVFPHGLQYLYNKSSLPVIAHNRYWSYKTPYAKQNGGTYDFIINDDTGFALPVEEKFWDFLFKGGLEWGLVNYEQDFLITQINEIKELNSDIFLGEKWLHQMGNSATRFNLKLQYCMAAPRHILQALEVPAVSHARVSEDYVILDQWRIGYTSMFTDAVGLAPFKDNFWTTSKQPGNPDKRTEINPEREAVISLISTGPVGISDKIGLTDADMAKMLCRKDGLLLKPSKPATAINQQIIQRAFGGILGEKGEVYTTYSDISNIRFGIIFASQLNMDFKITPSIAGFNTKQFGADIVAYPLSKSFDVHTVQPFSEQHPVVLSKFNNSGDMHLYFTSPVFSLKGLTFGHDTTVILGELSKYVPISPKRVKSIELESQDIIITLVGQIGEKIDFTILYNSTPKVIKCTIHDDGKAVLRLLNQNCS